MGNYLYLIINLSAVSVPLLFSFHPRLRFYNHFKNLLVGFLFMVPVFIVWDIYFTHLKVWGFNNDYLLGINIFKPSSRGVFVLYAYLLVVFLLIMLF